jgi:FKBP-type peptidyl-prolyl cis-trans isomerase
VLKRRAICWTLGLALVAVVGCEKKPAEDGAKTKAAAPVPEAEVPAAKPAEPKPAATPQPAATPPATAKPAAAVKAAAVPVAAKSEVEFDPTQPPAGYVNCHRNHCHKVGGGVASYTQVMAEMGATKIKGAPKPQAMPTAPADVAAAPADAAKTPSGLASKVLTAGGAGAKPGPTSVVTVHYTGWTTDGKAFDSSVARGKPATFPLNRVIAGWTEGLQLMTVGEERRLWIPEALAYKGKPGRPAGVLVFDVELLEIK